MNGKTLLFLALLVGGGWWLLQQQEQQEALVVAPYQGPLLGDFPKERLTEIRWEHVERNENVALERREGKWHLTDPMEYPAAPDRVQLVVDGLFTRAQEVPEPDRPAVEKHFDPPRAIVYVVADNESGGRREAKVELGALDADGMQVEARIDGRYVRILRNLDTALLSSTTDMRRKQVFSLPFDRIAMIERRGSGPALGGAQSLDFLARREGPHWVQHRPLRVQLDPTAMALQARVLSVFSVDGYASDVPDPDLARYGLLQPDLTLVLEGSSGQREELILTEASGGGWYAKRDDHPTIFAVGDQMMTQVLNPWAELRDTIMLRAFRQDIAEVEWQIDGQTLRLRQGEPQRVGGKVDWTVAWKGPNEADFGSEWPADLAKVQAWLGALEQNPIAEWLDRSSDWSGTPFPEGEPNRWLTIRFRYGLEGEVSRARFGAPMSSSAGTTLLAYQRENDQAIGLVPLDLQEWIRADLEAWRSPLIWNLVEGRLRTLRLAQGDREQKYARKPQGTWRFLDVDVRPTQLLPLLDHLVYLKAERHLPKAERGTLIDPVRIEWETVDGQWHIAEIGPVADGSVQIHSAGYAALAKDGELYERLVALLAP